MTRRRNQYAKTLTALGTDYRTSSTLFDSLLRERETQVASPRGGRIIDATDYDGRGLAYEQANGVYDPDHAPGSDFAQFEEGAAASRTITTFDGLERPTKAAFSTYNEAKWSTVTAYDGMAEVSGRQESEQMISQAAVVRVEDSRDAFTVAISEDALPDSDYLMIQCSQETPTIGEEELGLDSYCMMDGYGCIAYGGIRRVALGRTSMTLELTRESQSEFNLTDPQVEVVLDVSDGEWADLRDGLRRVCSFGNPSKVPIFEF